MEFDKNDIEWLISLLFPIICDIVKDWIKNKKKTPKQ